MTGERDGTATVIAHEKNRVQVRYGEKTLDVPTAGFPPSFRLQRGDKVILYEGESGLVARPLVRALTSRVAPSTLKRRGPVEIEGRRLAIQDSTVVYEPEGERDGEVPEEQVFWILESEETEGPAQVVAVRGRQQTP